jgi:hypothetical protein
MQSYFISILVSCVQTVVTFEDGDSWDYEYQWVCEEPSPNDIQVKAYQELPYTRTETVDLFNRIPVSEVPVE